MEPRVAVAHYPEGAGHATRMVAVAAALEEAGAEVTLAGGGPGRRFAERLGYEEFVPPPVDFIGDYQEGSPAAVLTGSLPDAGRRVRAFAGWLRRESPDVLVADDMFAALTGPAVGVPTVVLTHNAPGLYRDAVERAGAAVLTKLQVWTAREFLYPALWPPCDGDPAGVTRLGPVALDADAEVRAADVVVVPSAYSTALDGVADRLDGRGHRVARVGGPDWEPVDAMLPTLRAADRVVCAGYSTMMEAAVAGTPCVVVPHTSEQRGVARRVEDGGVDGFAVADAPDAAVEAVESAMPAPEFENAARTAAESVLAAVE